MSCMVEAIAIVTDDAVDIPLFHKNLMFAWNKDLNCVVHPDSRLPVLRLQLVLEIRCDNTVAAGL